MEDSSRGWLGLEDTREDALRGACLLGWRKRTGVAGSRMLIGLQAGGRFIRAGRVNFLGARSGKITVSRWLARFRQALCKIPRPFADSLWHSGESGRRRVRVG